MGIKLNLKPTLSATGDCNDHQGLSCICLRQCKCTPQLFVMNATHAMPQQCRCDVHCSRDCYGYRLEHTICVCPHRQSRLLTLVSHRTGRHNTIGEIRLSQGGGGVLCLSQLSPEQTCILHCTFVHGSLEGNPVSATVHAYIYAPVPFGVPPSRQSLDCNVLAHAHS